MSAELKRPLAGRIRQPRIVVAAVAGLVIAIMIAGGIGLFVVARVNRVANEALLIDVRIEDHGDDLRTAVLDLRHYHRNLVFAGPSRGGLEDFETAYAEMVVAIDDYAEVAPVDNSPHSAVSLRLMASDYYEGFRPAIDRYHSDPEAFTTASDEGLIKLDALSDATQAVDRLGEERAEAALANVEQSSRTAEITLLAVLLGAALIGAGLAWLVISTLNELRRLNAEQLASAEQLSVALQARNDFIADASHELRTPLTVLRGNAEVGLELERDCIHTPILQEIVRESARMTRLVEDLLLLARSDSSTLPIETDPIDADALAVRLVEPAEMLARERGAQLHARIQAQGMLQVDLTRIEQAVLVLVDNAAKYGASDEHGEPVDIELAVLTQGDTLSISVSDHGPGIPAEDLPRIFDRFYRVDKTRSRRLGGAGLGLSIARSIIEAHGGRITARSRLHEGTTMTITLPLSSTPEPLLQLVPDQSDRRSTA